MAKEFIITVPDDVAERLAREEDPAAYLTEVLRRRFRQDDDAREHLAAAPEWSAQPEPAGQVTEHDGLAVAAFADLDAATLYALLRLRADVFVVEQDCAYPELDGRDTEPGTRHVWFDAATAWTRRVPADAGRARWRRADRPGLRGRQGPRHRAGRPADAGPRWTLVGDRPCVLDAQAHLARLLRQLRLRPRPARSTSRTASRTSRCAPA